MIWENLKMALTSIRNAKMRSFLTMLGIIIGISSVVAINAIGEGVKQAVKSQVSDFGTNLLQINPGKSFGEDTGEGGGGFNPAASLGASTLTENDLKTVHALPDVEAAAPFAFVSGIVSAGDKTAKGGIIIATTADFPKALKVDLEKGRFFDAGRKDQAVLGYKAAEQLFGADDPIGKKIKLRNQDFEVVAVTKKPEKESLIGGGGMEGAVIIPFEVAEEYNGGTAQIFEIDVKIKEADRVKPAKQEIMNAIKNNHGGQDDFTVLTADEQLKVFDTILALLTTFIAGVASIALLVGGIGVMNIMLVSVTERTREIGIRKALGATRRMILTQFLIEAMVISLIGGALGCLAAVGLSTLVGKFAKLTPGYTPEMFLNAAGIAVTIGIIFGLAPAIKAARKKPIEALRYE